MVTRCIEGILCPGLLGRSLLGHCTKWRQRHHIPRHVLPKKEKRMYSDQVQYQIRFLLLYPRLCINEWHYFVPEQITLMIVDNVRHSNVVSSSRLIYIISLSHNLVRFKSAGCLLTIQNISYLGLYF